MASGSATGEKLGWDLVSLSVSLSLPLLFVSPLIATVCVSLSLPLFLLSLSLDFLQIDVLVVETLLLK